LSDLLVNFLNLAKYQLFLAELPPSCEQYFAFATFITSISLKSRGKMKNDEKKKRQLLMIDLDGGGPLKPFNVECLSTWIEGFLLYLHNLFEKFY
jgi:DNA replication protein DnaD